MKCAWAICFAVMITLGQNTLATRATLSGRVLDGGDATVLGVRVLLRPTRTGDVMTLPVGRDGVHNGSIEPGLYNVTLEGPDLMPLRRAMIQLHQGDSCTLDLFPVFRGGVALTIRGDQRLPDPVIRYDTFRHREVSELNAVIQYTNRSSREGAIEYFGRNVMLTYDCLTVRAASIILNPETFVFRAAGAVRISARDRTTAESATGDLVSRRLTISTAADVRHVGF